MWHFWHWIVFTWFTFSYVCPILSSQAGINVLRFKSPQTFQEEFRGQHVVLLIYRLSADRGRCFTWLTISESNSYPISSGNSITRFLDARLQYCSESNRAVCCLRSSVFPFVVFLKQKIERGASSDLHERDCDSDPLQRGASPNQTTAWSQVCENKQRCLGVKDQLKSRECFAEIRQRERLSLGDPRWRWRSAVESSDKVFSWRPRR